MSIETWRIVKTRHAAHAFDGEGARRFGGRWNSIGTRMVYCASSIALAVLEVLVHLEEPLALKGWTLCRVRFDDSMMRTMELASLPADWFADLPPRVLRETGDRWVHEQSSVVLAVPSAIVPQEMNHLLNPDHPEFRRIRIDRPQPFAFDRRLARG